jgi:Nse1 non-SMC component of SMC5-6 complex
MSQRRKSAGAGSGKGNKAAAAEEKRSYDDLPKQLFNSFNEVVAHFTTAMMNRGMVSRKACFYLLKETADLVCNPGDPDTRDHLTPTMAIDKANDNLAPFGFAIRKSYSEITGKLYYSFVNLVADDLAKSTAGKARESLVGFFKWIFEGLMDAPPGAGTVSRAQLQDFRTKSNLAKPPKALEIEQAIDRLLREGWLVEVTTGTKTEDGAVEQERDHLTLGAF